ncbi:MAG: hypothetical protein HRU03_03210 [Nanoarchaeales archaeon]|nr:hypothetical protein [Nanoarchaeales archaeon]
MNVLSRFHLKNYRKSDRDTFLKINKDSFDESKSEILEILSNTEFYHGTGAYGYYFETNKYVDSQPKGIKYILKNILVEGLVSQRDLFNDIFNTCAKSTISLGKNQIYARAYSELFLSEGTSLGYCYGNSLFWNIGVFFRIFTGVIKKKTFKSYINKTPSLEKKIYKVMLDGWSKSFRKDGKYIGKNYFYLSNARSDIKNNFGVVIGIKKNRVNPLTIDYPNISKDEVRTNQVLSFDSFSHLQVPIKNIRKVKLDLKKLNLKIPVIPIEFVELLNYERDFN